jgi:hypothetical protein
MLTTGVGFENNSLFKYLSNSELYFLLKLDGGYSQLSSA